MEHRKPKAMESYVKKYDDAIWKIQSSSSPRSYLAWGNAYVLVLTGKPGSPLSPGNPGKPGVPGIPVFPRVPIGPGCPSFPASP